MFLLSIVYVILNSFFLYSNDFKDVTYIINYTRYNVEMIGFFSFSYILLLKNYSFTPEITLSHCNASSYTHYLVCNLFFRSIITVSSEWRFTLLKRLYFHFKGEGN